MKYIIFDIDGTLTDTTKVDDKCYMESFESIFNKSIKDVQWNQLTNVTDWGIAEELIFKKLNRAPNFDDIQNLKKLFLKNLILEYDSNKTQFQEIEGASEFYKLLVNNNEFKIGIATGGWEETANFKLDVIGINPNTVCYSNSNHFKTREEITLDVINQLNFNSDKEAEEIIYFGDGEWDYKICRKLNIRFIGVDNQKNGKLVAKGAREVYNDFRKTETIINSIMK